MQLALLIYKYFPYGGLQRDFARLLSELERRGHRCRIYCRTWQGAEPVGSDLRIAPATRGSSVRRNEHFLAWVQRDLAREPVAAVVGFNKMPGLDVYYGGDSCFLEEAVHKRSFWYRLGWRFRHFAAWEQAVFDPAGGTEILLLSAVQQQQFERHYRTPAARLHLLPPGIEQDRRRPADAAARRAAARHALGLEHDVHTLLFVGSGFHRKGLDRAIRGLASLSRNHPEHRFRLLVAGVDGVGSHALLARRQQVQERVQFLGGRDDIPDLMLAADVLVHPARNEAAGIVLLEALVAGLPVVVTDVCGYACYIEKVGAGLVLPAPFEQVALNTALARMLHPELRETCTSAGLKYAENSVLYSLHSTAANLIEQLASRKTVVAHG